MTDKDINPRTRACALLERAALALVLAVVVVRPFISELPFRVTEFVFAQGDKVQTQQSPGELTTLTLSMLLLGAAMLWVLAKAIGGGGFAGKGFAILATAFLAASFLSAAWAGPDRRAAWDAWLGYAGILAAAMVVLDLASCRRRQLLVLAVLTGLAGAMGAKALVEVGSEIPDRIAAYRGDPLRQLQLAGLEPGTPQARMYEKRVTDPAALGYLGLSNVFGGLLIVPALAATGLALDKFRWARRAKRKHPRQPGDIPLPLLAAVLTLLTAALAWIGLLLSRSKGAIGAAGVALLLAVPGWIWPDIFRRHRRKLLAGSLLALLLLAAGVTGYGLLRHGLPGRSLQVRWEYWQGTLALIRQHPLLGAGPANFGDAYLLHRLPEAAESTKTPHNLLLEAAAQYGLPGGLLFLLLLGWMMVAATRPLPAEAELERGLPQDEKIAVSDPTAGQCTQRLSCPTLGVKAAAGWASLLGGAIVLMRAVWLGLPEPAVLLMEAVLPAGAFIVCFAAGAWLGGADGRTKLARGGLMAGLAGFVVQNLVEYTLWMPATATLFWVAAAACAAPANPPASGQRRAMPASPVLGWLLAAAAGVALVLAGKLFWEPVYQRTLALRQAQRAYAQGQLPQARQWLSVATRADRLDGLSASVLARLLHAYGPAAAAEAAHYARLAFEREPSSSQALLVSRVLRLNEANQREVLQMARKAAELDPMDVRTRLEYAELLAALGQLDESARQIELIRGIDNSRPADSDLRLTPRELTELDALEMLAGTRSALPTRPSSQP